MITICFTYFKSLTLTNFGAALYSVLRQDLSFVESIVVVDNDTPDLHEDIQGVLDVLPFPVPVTLRSFKHGDSFLTHSWSTNAAVRLAETPWVLFTRADYLLDFDLLHRFVEIAGSRPVGWDGFVTANVYHLAVDIEACLKTEWQSKGVGVLRGLPGAEADYTKIDSGVWMARRDAFERVGGLDENLTAWGHAQTHFQHKLYSTGTEFVRIPEPLFYHPQHAAPRDLAVAHQQLGDLGIDVREMWARHEGAQPYGRMP